MVLLVGGQVKTHKCVFIKDGTVCFLMFSLLSCSLLLVLSCVIPLLRKGHAVKVTFTDASIISVFSCQGRGRKERAPELTQGGSMQAHNNQRDRTKELK